jgi:predicted nucleotidyltransferase
MAKQDGSGPGADTTTVELQVPATNPKLFKHKATDDILRLLADNPYESFTIRELGRLTDHTTYSVKSAVDVLADNGIVTADTEGNRRPVSIDRTRLHKPDEPALRIPQPEFHAPVRAALAQIADEFDDLRGVLLFGSVARGRADRQSDVDLWILVENAGGYQHRANEISQELGQQRFGGNRYEFEILVESVESARGYADRLQDIFTDAITLRDSETLRDLKREVVGDA